MHDQPCEVTTTSAPRDVGRRFLLAAGTSLAVWRSRALAQAPATWPTRPVRVIVPYPPGGTADFVARLLFASVSQRLGQAFVIENRAGATGTIGAAAVANAAPDGQTVLYDATGLSVSPALFPRLSYVPTRDFVPVFQAVTVPQLVLVHPSSGARDVAALVALAKAARGGLNAASAGQGSIQHLVLELFTRTAGAPVNHIPYRGGAPAVNDLLAGQVQLYFGNVNVSAPYVRGGGLRALAHTGRGRLAALPDVPPLSDTFPGFETYEWNGVFLRSGTPRPIVARLNEALNAASAEPDVAEKLRAADLQVGANTPEQFGAFFQEQSERWQRFVREADIKID